ncbi:MAG: argininosuccinate lyase [Planctomycetota bacterium]|nr:argininosuccinate lyase [Planctomycetota bacterium]
MAVESIEDKDPALNAIHVSIGYDQRLWREDLDNSRAHVTMLGEQEILSSEDVQSIKNGLDQIEEEISDGRFPFRDEYEDIHLNIEQRLTELIGPVGGKLHTGRSRNDQVATDLRLWVMRSTGPLAGALNELIHGLLEAARRELDRGTVLPFYTHLQRAQPVLLAHHLLAHVECFDRDFRRFHDALERVGECPLGAGAGAGSGFPINPHSSAEQLGFDRPCRNSLDAVAARDFVLEMLAALSIHMVHLSRLAEEFILWSSQEFGFVRLSDKVTTGSSIMPQKRNPDGAELARGKAGRVFGHLQAMLTTLKALPLAYNKDLQEDKESLFDSMDTVLLCQRVLIANVKEASFQKDRMRAAVESRTGYANATELADYLADRGMPFRDAHAAVRKLCDEARTENLKLDELPLERFQKIAPIVKEDVYQALTVEAAIAKRAAPMGTAPERVREALEEAEKRWM